MQSMETLADDFVKVKPTFLIAVPRVFNKIYAGIHQKMEEEGGLSWNFLIALWKLTRKYRLKEGKVGLSTKLMYSIGSKLVFSKIKERFGGKLLGSITGSAQMNEEVTSFLETLVFRYTIVTGWAKHRQL